MTTAVAITLLASCVAAIIFAFACLVRGTLYRPQASWLPLKVQRRRRHANGWVTLHLRRTGLLAWKPLPAFAAGQSIQVAGTNRRIRRRYSLARWCRFPFRYEITIKPEIDGRMSTWLTSGVAEGDVLRVSVPSGDFVLPERSRARRCILIAGGVGITPLLAMLDRFDSGSTAFESMTLYWQVRSEQDLIYRNELDAIARRRAGLTIRYLVSRPETGTGARIDVALLRQELGALGDCHFLICAGRALLDGMISVLRTHGVTDHAIWYERFSIGATETDGGPWRLSVDGADITFDGYATLLDAFEDNDILMPSDCRAGTCGRCRVGVLSGDVRHLIAPEFPLALDQALACCAVPASDVILEIACS